MAKFRAKSLRTRKARLEPGVLGTPVAITRSPRVRLVSYDEAGCEERLVEELGELRAALSASNRVHWVDVHGQCDEPFLRELAEIFQIHPLALEDIGHAPQRPKIENFDHQLFILARMVVLRASHDMEADMVALFAGKNYVLTLHEADPVCFAPLLARVRRPTGTHRRYASDYLLYTLLDAIVDHCFPVLEEYGEYLDVLERETVTKPHSSTLTSIHVAKRELIELRRVLWPQREMIGNLIHEDSDLISDGVRVYLRDCLDHSVQLLEMVESYRDITSGLHDVYLSAMGQRTNEVVRLLTIISTIFIPLTFIVGVYGMNFNTETSAWNMPELNWDYGYPVTILLMVLISAGQLLFFWRRGWLTSSAPRDPRDLERPED